MLLFEQPVNQVFQQVVVDTRPSLPCELDSQVERRRPVVLFVDDDQRILDTFRRLLSSQKTGWDLRFVNDSILAWQHAQQEHVDVVVTDMSMPGMTGIELISRLRMNPQTADIPAIMLTGQDEPDLKRRAIDVGATDLLNKPVLVEDLLARVRSALRLKSCLDELKSRNASLEQRVGERTDQLQRSRREIIWRLGRAAEFRDSDTGRHVARVARFSQLIAQAMELPKSYIEMLYLAAPLHDVGKIGIPDAILLKPGRLTPEERAVMQEHCQIGAHILGDLMDWTPWDSPHDVSGGGGEQDTVDPVLATALEIALSHHEHWNGGGYPNGLAGEGIPLSGRIVALADVFDALTTQRTYKPAFTSEESLKIILEGVGRQFDPTVFAAFIRVLPEIEAARQMLSDSVSSKNIHSQSPQAIRITDCASPCEGTDATAITAERSQAL